MHELNPSPEQQHPALSNSATAAFLDMEISSRYTYLGGPAAHTWNQPANRSHITCLLPTTTSPPRSSATTIIDMPHRPPCHIEQHAMLTTTMTTPWTMTTMREGIVPR